MTKGSKLHFYFRNLLPSVIIMCGYICHIVPLVIAIPVMLYMLLPYSINRG